MMDVTSEVGRRALELYETGCVRIGDADPEVAIVKGRSGWYTVRATAAGPVCECRAWSRTRLCSHAASAMLAWRDMLASPPTGDAATPDAATATGAPPASVAEDSPKDAA